MHRVLVLWDLGYLREALSQFRLIAEEALRRLVLDLAPDLRRPLEDRLSQGQAAKVIERLHRGMGRIPARIALHLHTLLAWGNYASHHQKLGHHAHANDLAVLVAIAVDLEDWLAVEVEQSASVFDPDDMAWVSHQAEELTIKGGLDPAAAHAFVAGAEVSVQAESHRLVAPPLALELYWEVPPANADGEPYRGLRSFDPEDAPRFYGRRRLANQLEHLVDSRRLTVVSGASGAGKTSLLRAGLMPALLGLGCGVVYLGEYGERALQTVRRLLEVWPVFPPLVIVFDQFERALLSATSEATRRQFIDLVLSVGTLRQGRRVVVGLREDFLGPLFREAQHDGPQSQSLPRLIREEDALLTVGPLGREETQEAMLRPLEGTGIEFDEQLVGQVLLPELAESPSKLQIVCRRLVAGARETQKSVIDLELYESLGGTRSILATHLDDALSGPAYDGHRRDLARALLRAMTGDNARRWVDLGELWQSVMAWDHKDLDEVELRAVLGRLIDHRLVVSRSGGAGATAQYSLMHDQLVPEVLNWTTAREMEIRQTQDVLERALEDWAHPTRREPLGGRSLVLLENHWEALNKGDKGEAALALLNASRRARRTRRAGVGLLLTLAVLGLGFGVYQLRRAMTERDRAVTLADQGVLLKAQLALDSDPTLAVAWLRNLSLGGSGIGVLTLIEEARRRGVAWVLKGHTNLVTAATFSPDGRLLATASRDRTIRLWDPATHTQVGPELRGHGDFVSCVAFSPNGKYLVSSGWDGTVRLWNPRSHAQIAVLRCGDAWVHWLSLSPDGRLLVAGDAQGHLHRFAVPSGRRVGPAIDGHEMGILTVVHSPDGKLFASGSIDGTIRFWNAATGTRVGPVLAQEHGVYALAFSPDGKTLVSGGRGGTIQRWSISHARADVLAVVPLGRPLNAHAEGVLAARFAPDGSTLATAGADKQIRIWSVRQWRQAGPPLRGHLGLVHDVAFSPDGKTLVSTSRDHTVRLWDVSSRRQGGLRLRGHQQAVQEVAFAPDGKTLASASRDGSVRLWDAERLVERQRPLTTHGPASAVTFSPDGKWIAAGGDHGQVRVWERRRGSRPTILDTGAREVLGLAFSPDGRQLAAANSDGHVQVWRLPSWSPLTSIPAHTDAVFAVSFTPDGRHVVSAGRDGAVVVTAVGKPQEQHRVRTADAVYSVAVSPDGLLVATGGGDATIRVLYLQTLRQQCPPLKGHQHWVLDVAFSPDGKTIASASSDGTVRLWKTTAGAWSPLGPPLRGHTDWVNAVAFSPDGRTLASASADTTVWLWRLSGPTGNRELRRMIDRLTNLHVHVDGRLDVR